MPKNQTNGGKFSIRELDASYLDAVERGDMEAAQRGVIITEEQVRIYLRHKHLKAKQNIRKKYRTLIIISAQWRLYVGVWHSSCSSR